jgi:hypothetical protein
MLKFGAAENHQLQVTMQFNPCFEVYCLEIGPIITRAECKHAI